MTPRKWILDVVFEPPLPTAPFFNSYPVPFLTVVTVSGLRNFSIVRTYSFLRFQIYFLRLTGTVIIDLKI